LSCKNVQLQFYKQSNGNTGSELAYDDRLINKISQQVGKSSKVTLERTLQAASKDQKSRKRLMTLEEKILYHTKSTNGGAADQVTNGSIVY
jgi:hypothetical protein